MYTVHDEEAPDGYRANPACEFKVEKAHRKQTEDRTFSTHTHKLDKH